MNTNEAQRSVATLRQFSTVPTPRKRARYAAANMDVAAADYSSLQRLPEHIIQHIFDMLTDEDLEKLALTCKQLSTSVANWVASRRFSSKLVESLPLRSLNTNYDIACVVHGNGRAQLVNRCEKLALLLKKVTMLDSVGSRLEMFYERVVHLRRWMGGHAEAGVADRTWLRIVGVMLHVFIAGWHHRECLKVYAFFSDRMNLAQSMRKMLTGTEYDAQNERFLRNHMRLLFLDRCQEDEDRALWIAVMCNRSTASEVGRALLLLYAPTNKTGGIDWHFATNMRSYANHARHYVLLAKVLATLRHIPNWSAENSLQVLIYMSNYPSAWALRSFSALLLPLSVADKDLVIDYFNVLYRSSGSSGSSTASLLIALVLLVSRHLVGAANDSIVDSLIPESASALDCSSVERFIGLIFANATLPVARNAAVRQMWRTVGRLSADFAAAAADPLGDRPFDEDLECDFYDLTNAWAMVCSRLFSAACDASVSPSS